MDPILVKSDSLNMTHCIDPNDHKQFGFWLMGIGLNSIGGNANFPKKKKHFT
jgi:hypothetical protein